jgi:hypothetical protein
MLSRPQKSVMLPPVWLQATTEYILLHIQKDWLACSPLLATDNLCPNWSSVDSLSTTNVSVKISNVRESGSQMLVQSECIIISPPLAIFTPNPIVVIPYHTLYSPNKQTNKQTKNSLIRFCKTTRDYLVPSVWGPISKSEDPYAPQAAGASCCSVV